MVVEKMSKELMYKIALLGDGAVGKTSLIEKFITGKFEKDYRMTLGTNIFSKVVNINDPHPKHYRNSQPY